MCCVNEPFGIGALQTGQTHLEVGGDAESFLRAWTNADGRSHGGIRLTFPLVSNEAINHLILAIALIELFD
jgi:hypothetical protein